MDQQFEEMNNKLNSVTDPTGFLRMVSRNNLVNRWERGPAAGSARDFWQRRPARRGAASVPLPSPWLGRGALPPRRGGCWGTPGVLPSSQSRGLASLPPTPLVCAAPGQPVWQSGPRSSEARLGAGHAACLQAANVCFPLILTITLMTWECMVSPP